MKIDKASLRVKETHVGWGVLVLCIGVLVACGALVVTLDASTTASRADFQRLSQSISTEITRRLFLPGYGLGGARGAIAVKGALPDVEEFKRYVASRDLPVEFPGVTGIGLIVRIQREDLAGFEKDVAAQYDGGFSVRTSGEKPDLLVIRSIEPQGVNSPALGFDVGSEASRRVAVERSYITGLPSATAPIRLLQDAQHRLGTLYLVPIFSSGRPARSSPADQVIGLVYAAMTYDLLLDDVVSHYGSSLAVELRDIEAPVDEQLIFKSGEPVRPNAALKEVRQFDYGGRTFELTLASSEGFDAEQVPWAAWLAALVGFLASALGALLVVQLSTTRSKARAMAEAITVDLQRFEAMSEQSCAAAMLLDSSGRATWANLAMADLTGVSLEALVGSRAVEVLMSERTDIDSLTRLRRSLALKESFEGALLQAGPDGADIPMGARILPTFQSKGICTGFIVFMKPLSE